MRRMVSSESGGSPAAATLLSTCSGRLAPGMAGENADVLLLGEREELLDRLLAEDVEDDLDGLHARIRQGHPRLLDPLDADAVVLYLARLLQVVQGLEGLALAVRRRRRAVELEEVQGFYAEVLQAPLGKAGEVLVVVPFGGVGVETPAGLGGDEDLVVRPFAEQPADKPLAAAVAVHVRGVEEAHAEVDGPVQRGVGVLVAHLSPLAPERPSPEAYLRDPHPRLAEIPVLQVLPFLGAGGLVRQPVALDDLSVPAGARLRDAPLGAVVYENDTEAF